MQVKNVNSVQKTKRIKRIRGKGIPVKQSIWMKSIQMKSIQRKCRQMKKKHTNQKHANKMYSNE